MTETPNQFTQPLPPQYEPGVAAVPPVGEVGTGWHDQVGQPGFNPNDGHTTRVPSHDEHHTEPLHPVNPWAPEASQHTQPLHGHDYGRAEAQPTQPFNADPGPDQAPEWWHNYPTRLQALDALPPIPDSAYSEVADSLRRGSTVPVARGTEAPRTWYVSKIVREPFSGKLQVIAADPTGKSIKAIPLDEAIAEKQKYNNSFAPPQV